MSERELEKMESAFPALSAQVFREARAEALRHGLSVVESENGVVYEVSPDGRRREIKRVALPVEVEPGLKLTLR